MKRNIIIFSIGLAFVLALYIFAAYVALSQTPPPAMPTLYYEAQIVYGEFSPDDWEALPIQYSVVLEPITEVHKLWDSLGIQNWVCSAADSTTASPKKVKFNFTLTDADMNSQILIWYRVRVRAYTTEASAPPPAPPLQVGEWSEPSDWVGIVRIPKLPKAIH